MIGRIWHGWTSRSKAQAYERLLREEVLPEIEQREGCRGAYLLRRVKSEQEDAVEFITITLFDSLGTASAFSTDGKRGAVVPGAARALLSRFDEVASHYEILAGPEAGD